MKNYIDSGNYNPNTMGSFEIISFRIIKFFKFFNDFDKKKIFRHLCINKGQEKKKRKYQRKTS